MANPPVNNPPMPRFLRLTTWVECVVVFAAGFVLFFLPAVGREIWAWTIPPFNSRYVGAIYFAALLPLVISAVSGRWSPGKQVVWMIFSFTTCIMIAMLIHYQAFEWGRPATWAFWFLYLFLPVNSIVYLIRYRNVSRGDARPTPTGMTILLLLMAAGLGLYGLALLIAPELATAFWPWAVDAFHGRIYLTSFITPAVGALVLLRRASAAEYLTLGLTLLTLGVLPPLGVVLAGSIDKPGAVDYANLGTWAFFMMNLIIAGLGAILAWVSLNERPAYAKA